MKKVILASIFPLLMTSAFSSLAANPAPLQIDGGKINFTGAVVSAPCAVDNVTDDQTVRLGQVPTNRLVGRGSTSSAVPFTIKLTGCDLSSADVTDPTKPASYTSASVTFSGSTVTDDSTLAILSAASGAGDTTTAAQNVGIQILQNNTAVKVDGSTATTAHKILVGTNEIPFSAVYVATADGVVAGSANAIVNFLVNYE